MSFKSAADAITANDPLIQQAYQLLAKNELKAVAKILNDAQKNTTADPRIFLLGSRLAEQSGRPEQALEAAEHAVKLSPAWWPAQLEYGLLLARQDKYEAALAQAEVIFKLAPNERLPLAGVVDIATRSGNLSRAAEFIEHALTLYPNDPVLLMQLGRTRHHGGDYERAVEVWDRLIADNPDNPQPRYGRLQSLLQLGRAGEAQEDVQRLRALAPDDALYQYYAQVVAGETPATQPVELQQQVFDSLAEGYDLRMVRLLRYELPQQVARKILELFPDRKFNLLDLGCGTGLLGAALGRIDGGMVGVDVSSPMLAQAAKHHVYDKFHKVNVLDAVRDTPDALYEVIAALDVFPYVGDLQPVLGNVHRILQPDGFFFFSTC